MRYILLIVALAVSHLSIAQDSKKQITLEDIWVDHTFSAKSVPGFNAMKDGQRYTKLDRNKKEKTVAIGIYDLRTGNKEGNAYVSRDLDFESYVFSKDEQKILLLSDAKHIYRRSASYIVHVYDIKTGKLTELDEEKVLHASFSPDGSKVAFVKDNDLYYRDLVKDKTVQITSDGKWNYVINGNCDWVYEEEFGFTKAFQWSKDGQYLAFYRFDEARVKEFTLQLYGGLYPENYTYKYPKAGENNSIVRIKVYNLKNGVTADMSVGTETDQYIPRIKWSNESDKLCIYRLNRLQNKLDLLLADADNGSSEVIYTEENKYYIDINDNLEFMDDDHSFLFTSERDGYNHLYSWDWKSKKLNDLTQGKYDIESIVGIDKKRKVVYYTAAVNSPLERKLYSVRLNGKGRTTLTKEDGTHSITPIEGYKYFLDQYSRLNEPPIYYLIDAEGNKVKTLEDNIALAVTMSKYDLGKVEFTTFKSANGKDELNAYMITPPNFDKNKKYPVLMYQYSGPGSQQVADRFYLGNYFWHQMLAQKGYIVVCADGRGTGFRGEEFKKQTYLTLGNLESQDQIAIAKQLAKKKYVDGNRIGIWGWSYGGFMSSTCMFKGGDVFKAGIAVAPVTHWALYDNIYTERYMRKPVDNKDGYNNNAPLTMVDGLTGKFLLVHGTADDNVHYQNSMMLVDALIRAGKDFDSEFYPNKAHGISGGNTRYHLFKKMTDFILNNL